MIIKQIDEFQELRNIVDFLRINANPLEAQVLNRSIVDMLWKGGSKAWIINVDGIPTSLCMARRISKTRESYLSWYLSFTLPSARRRGYALALITHITEYYKTKGAQRIWGKVSTRSGYSLAKGFKMMFWGLTPDRQLVFDTPLYTSEELMASGLPGLPDGAPPMSKIFCATDGCALSIDTLNILMCTPLKFDLRPNQRVQPQMVTDIDPDWP